MKKMKLVLGILVATVGVASPLTVLAADTTDGTNGEVAFTPGDFTLNPDDGDASYRLPTDLNFGSHKIGQRSSEILIARKDGVVGGAITKGGIIVRDDRGNGESWSLTVTQDDWFKIDDSTKLENAELSFNIGELIHHTTTEKPKVSPGVNSSLVFKPGEAVSILEANGSQAAGETLLALESFELAIPANADKKVGTYTTSLTWTLNDGTTP